ncbi:MAG: hypothetical protein KJO54_00185 [Gammaproteobacteria bacterium]|nr:hypothetical protein [Gammaproteobacteria bacterium]NNF62106.1 hypothetical protein [Gammaproteobacteria bacterium]NNM20490.1 hypothetical protein [Gammaproteobacteria bacterium]
MTKQSSFRRRPVSLLFASLFLLAPVMVSAATTAATGPTIRLFPTTVLEDIRHTGQVAEEMESGLNSIIAKLDQQQQLFVEAKCDGAEGDPGCDQIARQLGATYLEMLNVMSEGLPDMERAVMSTRNSLEKRLRTEVGKKMTPWDLQENLLGKTPAAAAKAQPAMRGRSGLRLSERFRQYYSLVASGGGAGAEQSLTVVAADIYLDMDEAAVLIARTQEEISRATLLEQLNQSFGVITPEMQEVVAGVKSILFGDFEAAAPIAGPPPGDVQQAYSSPLEM